MNFWKFSFVNLVLMYVLSIFIENCKKKKKKKIDVNVKLTT